MENLSYNFFTVSNPNRVQQISFISLQNCMNKNHTCISIVASADAHAFYEVLIVPTDSWIYLILLFLFTPTVFISIIY